MSRKCAICGKGPQSGNLVSHSNRKTRTTFKANIQKKSVEIDGKQSKEYVCTKCLKTSNK